VGTGQPCRSRAWPKGDMDSRISRQARVPSLTVRSPSTPVPVNPSSAANAPPFAGGVQVTGGT
jgi:hypothetical protein